MNRQQFIIDTLLPYFQDPSTCAYENGKCMYMTHAGKKCAVGKHIRPEKYTDKIEQTMLMHILNEDNLTPEAMEQELTYEQWCAIQAVHDNLATGPNGDVLAAIVECESRCAVSLAEIEQLFNLTKTTDNETTI